ncbi:MAG: CDP-glycerol glycerophosphotransferase family protein [Spirochaetaceae bacterium]|jgi:hypothetical protein|nr:CDP-glycerol glycerophosphotransferase family protein [Spirochaetaceae bacterium]
MLRLFPLYIDPGTGSMLFSILIGVAATGYFLFRAFIIKIKVFFSGGRASVNSNALPYVIYCEDKRYVNVFKPVLDEFEKRQIHIEYLSSDPDDPILQCCAKKGDTDNTDAKENGAPEYQFVNSRFIGQDNKAFAHLNLLNAHVVLMTTPGLDVYQLKRSKLVKHYSHVLHAASDATMYKMFGIDYFDSILLTGDYQKDGIRALEKIRGLPEKELVTVGCSYLDVYEQKMQAFPKEDNHIFTVLVSPSWGASSLLCKFGEKLLDPLVKTGWRIIVRPHPQSKKSEPAVLEKLATKYKDNLQWDYERESLASFTKSDIMLSDFSGIIYDYIFLCNKPVMYVNQNIDMRPYDADDLGDDAISTLWQFSVLKTVGIELKEESFENIDQVITDAVSSGTLKTARNKAKEDAWQYSGEAGKRIADFMIQKNEACLQDKK